MNNFTLTVTGTRGIPNILGGIETHCQELYPRIKKISNVNISIIRRSTYIIDGNKLDEYNGITLKDIYTPKKKSFEAIIHTFLSVIYAKIKKSYDLQSDPRYAAARMWIDEIIDPRATRNVLIRSLQIISNQSKMPEPKFGVLQV